MIDGHEMRFLIYGDMRKLPIAWHLHMLSGVTLIGVWLCFYANELKHQTQAPNATSNGGDASRVIYSIGLCKFAKIINISSGRRPIPRLS